MSMTSLRGLVTLTVKGGQRRGPEHVRAQAAVTPRHCRRGMTEELAARALGATAEHEMGGVGVAGAGVERERLGQVAGQASRASRRAVHTIWLLTERGGLPGRPSFFAF